MKSGKKYLLLLVLFVAFVAMIVIFRERTVIPALLSRNQAIAGTTEWLNTKDAIEHLLSRLRANPDDDEARLSLALAYIQEGRVTGNHGYYDPAALQLIDALLTQDENNYDAICAKATVLLSQHHFQDALIAGKKAAALRPHSAAAYGILTDANVELGEYEAAVVAAEKMNDIRPDLRSYARISYLREIFGDVEGAKEAMNMAVQSGVPGTEQMEWVRSYLARLYETSGDPATAEMLYERSLVHRPNYAVATAGLGRIALASGRLAEAEQYFLKARNVGQADAFSEELSGLYRMMDLPGKSLKVASDAIVVLSEGSGEEGSSGHGHYSDKELALLYLQTYQYDLALKHALIEYRRRPKNIDVNRTLAWVHFRRGEYKEANNIVNAALRTGCQHPSLLLEAGLIKAKAGDVQAGRKLADRALSMQPCHDALLRADLARVFGTVPAWIATN